MRLLALALPFLACTVARAEEQSLLARLQDETRALAEVARRSVVKVRTVQVSPHVPPGAYRVRFGPDGLELARESAYWVALGQLNRARASVDEGVGILVGTPPVLVFPYRAWSEKKSMEVRLPDGRMVETSLWEVVSDLGIAVHRLPPEVAESLQGIEPASDWEDLSPGSLGVTVDRKGETSFDLAFVTGADSVSGDLEFSDSENVSVLIGVGGKLLAFRAPQPAAFTGGRSRNGLGPDDIVSPGRLVIAPAEGAGASRNVSATFAPGPVLARVLADLREHGRIRHAYLGVVLGDTVSGGKTVLKITAVLERSPAAEAGLKEGDRILAVNGRPCVHSAELARCLAVLRPGDTVEITLACPGEEEGDETRTIQLADRAEVQTELVAPEGLGLECAGLTPDLRGWLGLDEEVTGVLVRDVRAGSPAEAAGLARGDLIVAGEGGPIADLEELQAAVASASGTLRLEVLRAGERRPVALKLPGGRRKTR